MDMTNAFSEQFSRTAKLMGPEVLKRWQAAEVVVAGVGAVGGYAVEALARSGVGHLRLVDYDRVELSNLNRQVLAVHSTLGRQKTILAAERVRDINPQCQVSTIDLRIDAGNVEQVLAGIPDLVVDAIDDVDAKIELIAAAQERGLPIVSSMGAARRIDPGSVRTGLLSRSEGCPLARLIRRRLRQRGLSLDIPCVYSIEPAAGGTHTHATGQGDSGGSEIRKRVLGSLPTLTGIIGLTLAHVALMNLLDSAHAKYGPSKS
ncbi:MAG TPA: ThiF family adenylyltransferase [Candidatus Paceibacterota bacterium]|nr:ThiF family adenylyltransferase [Candidatus Paceibacterota bacterium]